MENWDPIVRPSVEKTRQSYRQSSLKYSHNELGSLHVLFFSKRDFRRFPELEKFYRFEKEKAKVKKDYCYRRVPAENIDEQIDLQL